jgi:hypothetical protein
MAERKGGKPMMLKEMFVANKDTDTHRVCGTCGTLKPITEFYRDGLDKNGNKRYRRDCKDCYKKTRVSEDALKQRRMKK